MRAVSLTLSALALWLALTEAVTAVEVRAAVIRVDYPRIAPISRLEAAPEDLAFAGAALALQDNETTGGFLGHVYLTETVAVPAEEVADAFTRLRAEGFDIFVVLAQADDLLALVDQAPDALFLNAGAREVQLRDAACRANLLHVTPSDAMRADAVAQFAVLKRWPRWLLVTGSNPADALLAEAYRRAAGRFGAELVEEREIRDTGGSRRADTGHVAVQRQIPVLVQGAAEHDAVVAADASDVFAPYLPFQVWDPRPVLGSAGLRPVSFNPAIESWGGTQFQRRFERVAGRRILEEDYDTWLALRAIGEAVTRTGSGAAAELRTYLLGPEFELAAFKGQPLTFRPWNGQMRQPVLLYDGRITASVSPQEGFLHPTSPLDTLGLDRPDSACTAFE
ncbi:MAG: ABC transporter substrate-binding protein [Pseudomonadota bacterium]